MSFFFFSIIFECFEVLIIAITSSINLNFAILRPQYFTINLCFINKESICFNYQQLYVGWLIHLLYYLIHFELKFG